MSSKKLVYVLVLSIVIMISNVAVINFHKQKMQPAKYRHLDITPFSMDEINYIKLLDVIAKINRTFRNSLLFLRKLIFEYTLAQLS